MPQRGDGTELIWLMKGCALRDEICSERPS
jgi:hypothetical protein